MKDPAADPRRAAAKAFWHDTALSAPEIAIRVGVSERTVRRWSVLERWRPRASPAFNRFAARAPEPGQDQATGEQSKQQSSRPRTKKKIRSDLVTRLYRLLDHNIEVLESQMSEDNGSGDAAPERNLRTISNMVRSAEKLKELDTEQSKRLNTPPSGNFLITPEEEERIRRKVVEHVQRLRERKLRERGEPPA